MVVAGWIVVPCGACLLLLLLLLWCRCGAGRERAAPLPSAPPLLRVSVFCFSPQGNPGYRYSSKKIGSATDLRWSPPTAIRARIQQQASALSRSLLWSRVLVLILHSLPQNTRYPALRICHPSIHRHTRNGFPRIPSSRRDRGRFLCRFRLCVSSRSSGS